MSTNGHMNGEVFDIDTIASNESEDLAIVHPSTGRPTTWIWTLAGPSHPASVDQSNRSARDTLRVQRMREQAIVNRKKWIEPEQSPDEVRKENCRSFAQRVLGWTPARINGEDYPFSTENAVKLLLNPSYGRVYMQLLEYFQADDSFMKRSGTGSQPSPSASSS